MQLPITSVGVALRLQREQEIGGVLNNARFPPVT